MAGENLQGKGTLLFAGKVIAACILVSVVTFVCLESLLSITPNRYSEIGNGSIETALLVIGNSRGDRLMTGEKAGDRYDVYNLSSGSLKRSDVSALLKDFFSKGNKADKVVVEASTLFRSSALCSMKTYWSMLPYLAENGRENCTDDRFGEMLAPLSIYNTQLFRRDMMKLLRGDGSSQDRPNRWDVNLTPEQCRNMTVDSLLNMATDLAAADIDEVRGDIESLESWIEENGYTVDIYFVLAPYMMNENTREAVRLMQEETAVMLKGLDYLDLAGRYPDACTYFSDSVHVNSKGIVSMRDPIRDFVYGQ